MRMQLCAITHPTKVNEDQSFGWISNQLPSAFPVAPPTNYSIHNIPQSTKNSCPLINIPTQNQE